MGFILKSMLTAYFNPWQNPPLYDHDDLVPSVNIVDLDRLIGHFVFVDLAKFVDLVFVQ